MLDNGPDFAACGACEGDKGKVRLFAWRGLIDTIFPMLKTYSEHGQVYAEITRGAEDRGGPGWDFGTCLWIPSRNAAGADRYGLIRQVQPGNLVLHSTARDWDKQA